ncbi:MAG: SIMPL domain-containing protein [Pseudomonadota bacterium]|nr:SIMPL domain-containing protein [Pseudomonadota bacterium]
MTKTMLALMIGAATLPLAPAAAQDAAAVVRPVAGTRLDISATGSVSRVPDLAIISAGVVTKASTASGAIASNAMRMERVRAALKRAGIADRDIQTSSINLNPDYRYDNNQPPVLTGYQATNNVSIKFRDIRNTGKILDALVAEGANQINGPSLTIDKPETAYDEARTKALAVGRARADLYARSLGMRVVRLIAVSEGGGYSRPPMPYAADAIAATGQRVAKTEVAPGSQDLEISLSMSFELQ